MPDLRLAGFWPDDADDVEAGGAGVEQAVAFQVVVGGPADALLLASIDGFGGIPVGARAARLDFDKNHGPPLEGDQIDFAELGAMAGGQDDITLATQELTSDKFPALAQCRGAGPSGGPTGPAAPQDAPELF